MAPSAPVVLAQVGCNVLTNAELNDPGTPPETAKPSGGLGETDADRDKLDLNKAFVTTDGSGNLVFEWAMTDPPGAAGTPLSNPAFAQDYFMYFTGPSGVEMVQAHIGTTALGFAAFVSGGPTGTPGNPYAVVPPGAPTGTTPTISGNDVVLKVPISPNLNLANGNTLTKFLAQSGIGAALTGTPGVIIDEIKDQGVSFKVGETSCAANPPPPSDTGTVTNTVTGTVTETATATATATATITNTNTATVAAALANLPNTSSGLPASVMARMLAVVVLGMIGFVSLLAEAGRWRRRLQGARS
jgi:hypothetical protein